jgi:hypothetical protein
MRQKKQIFKKNKEFNLVVDFFGGLTNTAKVLDISYPYASHISTGRRRLSPIYQTQM